MFVRFFKDLKNYRNYVFFAVKAGLKAEVAGSYLNWIWWVLEPFCFMIIYVTVFGMIFESAEENFPIFIFIGNTIWAFFSKCLSSSVSMIKQNETIISRIYIPKYVLLLVEMGINTFKMMLNFIIVAIMLIIFRVEISFHILYAIPVLMTIFIVTFSFGVFLMHFGVYIEDLSYIVSILLNMLMFFSGVFYSVENRLDYPYGTIIGHVNPIAFLMTSLRNAVMYCKSPELPALFIWLMIGIALSFAGIRLLYKNENNYAKVI